MASALWVWRRPARWGVLALGLVLTGAGVWFGICKYSAAPESTPLGRVERVLAEVEREPDFQALERDVVAVRQTLKGSAARVFELVVALRLSDRGAADYERAARDCQALGFVRCERGSLEEMRQRAKQPSLGEALEELVWHYGTSRLVREVLKASQLPRDASAPTKERAVRTRLRLGVVAPTPDARAALLSEACALQPASCAELPAALERMARTRPVAHEPHLLLPPEVGQAGPPAPATEPFAP